MRQKTVITKLLQSVTEVYYKVRQVLQSATVITKWDVTMYIKYVGGGTWGFYKFFKKSFVAQGTIELNISWPSNFFEKTSWPLQSILFF